MLEIIRTAPELFARTERARKSGESVGLVPTMGALHEGHMSLVDAVRAKGASVVVVTIFVNPLQFGPTEDLAKYPRTFDHDRALCEKHGVNVIYAPSPEAMYPTGFQTHVEVEQVTRVLEGVARPTHFRGVTTVVTKLFNAAGPCIAAFGKKDYQQWRTLERMVRDLDQPITMLGCPIVREPDGLALSSRNRYLSPDERARSTAIYAGLHAASRAFAEGERDADRLIALAREPIARSFDSIDYVALADADELVPATGEVSQRVVTLVAARIGTTRLIDNAVLGEECLVTLR
jgi:pantoate--beta-alanine ligase